MRVYAVDTPNTPAPTTMYDDLLEDIVIMEFLAVRWEDLDPTSTLRLMRVVTMFLAQQFSKPARRQNRLCEGASGHTSLHEHASAQHRDKSSETSPH